MVDGDLDGDLGLGGVLYLSLLGEGDAVGLLRAGEQDGVAVFGRLERLEPSCLYATFLLGDWGVLIRGDGDLWRLRAGDFLGVSLAYMMMRMMMMYLSLCL